MNVKIKDKCVCVTSGGMDSISMALKMYHDGYDITLFHIDLNQKSEAREHIAVQIIAEALDVRYKFINCHWLGELGGSSLTDEDIGIPEGMDSMEESLNINERNEPGLWTPARNVVLLAAAAAYGERFGAKLIAFGANQSEIAYKDNTMEFADRFTHMLKYGCLKPLIVTAPLYEMDKVQLIKWGCDNGYKKIYNHTWSCDDGQDIPCGVCGCCCNRRLAYYILGSIYGTDIEDYMDGQKYIDEAYFTDIFLPKASSIRKGFWWEKYSTCL